MRDELIEAVAQALADLRGYGISNQDRRNAQAALAVIEARGMLSQGWQDIASAPHACHVLATRWGDDAQEWVTSVVASPPSYPFTLWQPLPAPPVAAAEGVSGSSPCAPAFPRTRCRGG